MPSEPSFGLGKGLRRHIENPPRTASLRAHAWGRSSISWHALLPWLGRICLGFDADPAIRNVVGLIERHPELAIKAVKLRKFGQEQNLGKS